MTHVNARPRWGLWAAVFAAAMALTTPLALPAQAATPGGPIILMGIDAEDAGHGPPATYAQVVESILRNTDNGGDGILVFGAHSAVVKQWWDTVGAEAGETVTHVIAPAIGTVDFTGYQMLAVSSDVSNTAGGTRAVDNLQLATRRGDVADFVNGGGGLFGLASVFTEAEGGPYPYLADLGAFTFAHPPQYPDITPTAEGSAVGISDALDLCCWHDEYLTFPPFLQVLATNPATGNAAAVGGLNVVIGDLTLSPETQTRNIADTATIDVSVVENGAPATDRTVTFEVLSGPNAGTSGTATTDADGQATFSYSGSTAGTDTVQASYVPPGEEAESSNVVEVVWENPNNPPTADAGVPYAGEEGSPVTLDGTAADQNGDPLTLTWSYTPGADVDPGATCDFGAPSSEDTTFTCDDDGTYDVVLTADDGTTTTASPTASVTLANAAPQITSVTASTDDPIRVGTPISVTAPYTDAGDGDTHTCDIAWGDSTSSAGAVSPGDDECTGSHTYASAGVHTVKVTVTDDDTASDTASYQYAVAYDPDGGFVIGGGTVNMPVGAFPASPSKTGQANFGFVAKYLKGRSVPDGQTLFHFHAAGFKFHSDDLDWLAISGTKAQYKGTGTVNRQGGYGFMITATDGRAPGADEDDRLRIKVWDKATGEVVLDNQMGSPDDTAASTAVTCGAIVIHTR